MKKKSDRDYNKFEFVLTINGNIVCARYFNVPDFNVDKLSDMKDLLDSITGMNNDQYGTMGIIPKFFKDRSVNLLWESYNPHIEQTKEDIDTRNVFENEDIIGFKLKYEGRLIGESQFSGNYFQPKVRYEIDIREITPSIFNEVKYHLS